VDLYLEIVMLLSSSLQILGVTKKHKTMRKFSIAMMAGIAATTTGTILGSTPAHGASFTGSLRTADDIYSASFTADGISTINFRSYGYAGGTNAAGAVIAAGGFSPVVTLFDRDNKYSEYEVSSGDFDFARLLPAGSYRAVISTFPNFFDVPDPLNNPNPLYSLAGFLGGGDFGTDLLNNSLTSAYAFDIVNQAATSVPEPSSLIGSVLVGFAVVKFKRKLSLGKTS
jgi:hypothetical protein